MSRTSSSVSLVTSSSIRNEVPSGTIDGSNTTFTTASSFSSGSLRVYKNGIRLKGGGADFTENGSSNGFSMVAAPATGTVLLVDYDYGSLSYAHGSNSTLTDEVPSGTKNGSNTSFTTARGYIAGTLEVFVNGLKQARGTHFTETVPVSGSFTITDAPLAGDNVIVNYQYNLNPVSNADTVDGINASVSPTANQLVPLDTNARFDQATLPLGSVVQIVSTNYTSMSTGTTIIPNDNTPPQITEGTQFMSQTITPKSITNRLSIEAVIYLGFSSNGNRIAALFQDSGASAIAAGAIYVGNFGDMVPIYLRHDMVAGTTSSTTFTIRAGSDAAGTVSFNGSAGTTARFGGITISNIKITEYKA